MISAQDRTTFWSWTDDTAPITFYQPLKQAMRRVLQELDRLDHVEGFGDSANAKPSPQITRDFSPVAAPPVPTTSQPQSGGDALALAIASLAQAILQHGQPKKRGRPKKLPLDKPKVSVAD